MWISGTTLPSIAVLLAALHVQSLDEAPTQESASSDSLQVHFPQQRTVLWAQRSTVLSFEVDQAPDEDRTIPIHVEPAGSLEVWRSPTVSAGNTTGSLRVRARQQGQLTLLVGETRLAIEVLEPSTSCRFMTPEPRISVPVAGTVVWGRFAVACEVTCKEARAGLELFLELPDGRRLTPPATGVRIDGPTLRAQFEVDASELAPGTCPLRAILSEDGTERASTVRQVTVVHPDESLWQGECEDSLDEARPEIYGDSAPRVGRGAGASGGHFVVIPRPNPQWVLPVSVPKAGHFQLMLTVRGDFAGGAFPSLGLSLDNPNPILASTPSASHAWHRVPVGPPIALEGGEHHLGVRYLNELNVGSRSDRNLYLDRWELVSVDAPQGSPAATMMASSLARMQPKLGTGVGLWIALDRPFDGLSMNGRLRIEATVNWSGPEDSETPWVDLLVDGAILASQQAAKPTFALDRSHLGEGLHELRLIARDEAGRRAETPVQRLRVQGPVAESSPRDTLRFSVLDERWGDSATAALDGRGEQSRQRVLQPRAAMEAVLELPPELEGPFEALLEARGPGSDASARVGMCLEQQGETGETIELIVQNNWRIRPLGEIELRPGPKRVRLQLEPNPEDPRLRIRSLLLRRRARSADRTPPHAKLLYPAEGQQVHGVDSVVVMAFDDDELQSADVLIDGRPQGTHGFIPPGAGPLVLPLLLRDIEAGEHSLAVRVIDRAGNLGESEPQSFTVLPSHPSEAGPYARALHLLNRLALGPDPLELAEILTAGEQAWLARSLTEPTTGDRSAREHSETRVADALAYDAERLALNWLLRTDNPVRARLVLWVEDHFSTWSGKTGLPAEWSEHEEYARLGLAPFGELLLASATSPTMLRYLDQVQSYAGRLNENYARELLELHTLGVDGGYDQTDVTELARLLCGLTASQEAPASGSGAFLRMHLRFAPDLAHGGAVTLLGQQYEADPARGRFDRFLEVLERLARHPSTARHLSTKLAEHYVAIPAPADLVQQLQVTFLESGGDLRALLRAIVEHPAFWKSAATPRVATPLDFGLRVARTTFVPSLDGSLRQFLRNSGMGLFDCATPDGYPDEDQAWTDTNGLMQRWSWVQEIPWAVRRLVPDRARRYSGGDAHAWRQRVIDLAAVRLTGWTLGPESNTAALEFLRQDDSPTWEKVDRLALLVCRLPEANLK